MILRTVRFLNGDLVTYDTYDTNDTNDTLIDAICDSYPTPIHPFQVCLCEDEEKEMINVLIFPQKRVVVKEFRHIIADFRLTLHDLELEKITNESLLSHILRNTPVEELPSRIFSNPHPLVVDFLHTSGIFRHDQSVDELDQWIHDHCNIQNIQNNQNHRVFNQVLHNPADQIVDILLRSSQFRDDTRALIRLASNKNPRVADCLFERYRAWMTNNYALLTITNLIMLHPFSTEEMIQTVSCYLPDYLIYSRLRLMATTNEITSSTWKTLYARWEKREGKERKEEEGHDQNDKDLIRLENMLMEKRYTELIHQFGGKYSGHLFNRLQHVSESDEVADWLLSVTELRATKLQSNPHPRIVEWALQHWWYTPEFMNNRNPRVIDRVVDYLTSSTIPTRVFPKNLEVVWRILSWVRNHPERANMFQVTFTDFLQTFQFCDDVEIVFGEDI